MAIDLKLIDELLKDYKDPEDVTGENGLLAQLTKAVIERAMAAEMTGHVGYEKHDLAGNNSGNSRNGSSGKKLKGSFGELELDIPRDRNGTFEPKIVGKHQRRFTGFDEKIVSMYAWGMSTRDISAHLEEMYQVEVSPALISTVTEGIIEDAEAWRSRPLEAVYPIVFLDAIHFKVRDRDSKRVVSKAVYIALGVRMDGIKEVLGFWIGESEGAKFWLSVVTELKNRGVVDIFIACVDGLKGFPEAIAAVFPLTEVQGCIVHMVRSSMRFVNWKERKAVAADLRLVYASATEDEGLRMLDAFEEKWGARFPSIVRSWRSNWTRIATFFAFPPEIRKVIYTTNAIESLNMTLRKVTKARGSFPNEESLTKLLYLALENAAKKWTMPIHSWNSALNQFAIIYEDRFPQH
jgi:putative transposase